MYVRAWVAEAKQLKSPKFVVATPLLIWLGPKINRNEAVCWGVENSSNSRQLQRLEKVCKSIGIKCAKREGCVFVCKEELAKERTSVNQLIGNLMKIEEDL